MKTTLSIAVSALLLSSSIQALAGPEDFIPGPLIKDFGQYAPVPEAAAIPEDMVIKMAYDARDGGVHNEINGTFNSVAGLMNTLVASGVEKERIQLAIVIHGPAYRDILTNEAYGGKNPNVPLLEALLENGVRIYYCGQAAVYRDVALKEVVPGIQFSHSASAAHAVLQMEGYGVRPY